MDSSHETVQLDENLHFRGRQVSTYSAENSNPYEVHFEVENFSSFHYLVQRPRFRHVRNVVIRRPPGSADSDFLYVGPYSIRTLCVLSASSADPDSSHSVPEFELSKPNFYKSRVICEKRILRAGGCVEGEMIESPVLTIPTDDEDSPSGNGTGPDDDRDSLISSPKSSDSASPSRTSSPSRSHSRSPASALSGSEFDPGRPLAPSLPLNLSLTGLSRLSHHHTAGGHIETLGVFFGHPLNHILIAIRNLTPHPKQIRFVFETLQNVSLRKPSGLERRIFRAGIRDPLSTVEGALLCVDDVSEEFNYVYRCFVEDIERPRNVSLMGTNSDLVMQPKWNENGNGIGSDEAVMMEDNPLNREILMGRFRSRSERKEEQDGGGGGNGISGAVAGTNVQVRVLNRFVLGGRKGKGRRGGEKGRNRRRSKVAEPDAENEGGGGIVALCEVFRRSVKSEMRRQRQPNRGMWEVQESEEEDDLDEYEEDEEEGEVGVDADVVGVERVGGMPRRRRRSRRHQEKKRPFWWFRFKSKKVRSQASRGSSGTEAGTDESDDWITFSDLADDAEALGWNMPKKNMMKKKQQQQQEAEAAAAAEGRPGFTLEFENLTPTMKLIRRLTWTNIENYDVVFQRKRCFLSPNLGKRLKVATLRRKKDAPIQGLDWWDELMVAPPSPSSSPNPSTVVTPPSLETSLTSSDASHGDRDDDEARETAGAGVDALVEEEEGETRPQRADSGWDEVDQDVAGVVMPSNSDLNQFTHLAPSEATNLMESVSIRRGSADLIGPRPSQLAMPNTPILSPFLSPPPSPPVVGIPRSPVKSPRARKKAIRSLLSTFLGTESRNSTRTKMRYETDFRYRVQVLDSRVVSRTYRKNLIVTEYCFKNRFVVLEIYNPTRTTYSVYVQFTQLHHCKAMTLKSYSDMNRPLVGPMSSPSVVYCLISPERIPPGEGPDAGSIYRDYRYLYIVYSQKFENVRGICSWGYVLQECVWKTKPEAEGGEASESGSSKKRRPKTLKKLLSFGRKRRKEVESDHDSLRVHMDEEDATLTVSLTPRGRGKGRGSGRSSKSAQHETFRLQSVDMQFVRVRVMPALQRGINSVDDETESSHVISIMKNKSKTFVDANFPPDERSVYGYSQFRKGRALSYFESLIDDVREESENPEIPRAWVHARMFLGENFSVFDDGVTPDDIVQGDLEDCWLLSAVAAVATRPRYIRKLFITENRNEAGIYEMQFCFSGRWTRTVVDSFFPVLKGTCHPAYSRNNGQELWAMLLEKAYAKYVGSYANLNFGSTSACFRDLTGCPVIRIRLAGALPHDRASAALLRRKELATTRVAERLWHSDVDFFEELDTLLNRKKYLMTAVTSPNVDEDMGLVAGHFYTIVDVRQYEDIRLIRMRNPWGHREWLGAFGDKSSSWTPHLRAVFGWEDKNDGQFWLPIDIFRSSFQEIVVCATDESFFEFRRDIRLGASKADRRVVFELDQACDVYIGLHQPDARHLRLRHPTYEYLPLGFKVSKVRSILNKVLYRSPVCLAASLDSPELHLEPGRYDVSLVGALRGARSRTVVVSIHAPLSEELIRIL